jgi:hypothetical protein
VLGPFVDAAAVLTGGFSGAFMGHSIHPNLRTRMPSIFGLASMGLGVAMIVKVKFFPAVVLALIVGTIIGELCHLETGITRVATHARGFIDRIAKPADQTLTHEQFLTQFVAILVLFCISAVGVFGALTEGMTGDPSLLLVKAILDFFTAAIFAAALGYSVAILALPLLAVQATLFFLATWIMPMTTPAMIGDFSACGGLIMVATGFRMAGMKSYAVANMLPALLLAMPASAVWGHFFAR